MITRFFRSPIALIGLFAIGAAIGVSSVGIVRADISPMKSCSKSSACLKVTNTGSGPAAQLTATAANQRALYVYSTASGADGADINGGYIGIIGRAPAGSGLYPLVLTDSNGSDEDFTDTDGNLYYNGSLIQFAKTRGGQIVTAYGCQSTTHTLEDVGTGHLNHGVAYVHFHRTFGASIELRNDDPYRVFVTPNGDTHGLYVAQKLANGFIVRESMRGRGNVDFDYRVVATALGHSGERMGVTPLPQMPHVPAIR